MSAVPSVPIPLLYTRKAAAQQLSISARSLDRLISHKQLSTRRIGGRVLIPASELRRFARADHPIIPGEVIA